MDKKFLVFISVLLLIALVSAVTVLTNRKEMEYKPGLSLEYDKAVNQAHVIYEENKNLSVDFSKGPCLTNGLMKGWVLDLVHSPRQPIDDLPENQCQSFREGSATHFVELDLEGNVIRVF